VAKKSGWSGKPEGISEEVVESGEGYSEGEVSEVVEVGSVLVDEEPPEPEGIEQGEVVGCQFTESDWPGGGLRCPECGTGKMLPSYDAHYAETGIRAYCTGGRLGCPTALTLEQVQELAAAQGVG